MKWKDVQFILKRLLFLVLAPIYVSVALFLFYTYDWWAASSDAPNLFRKVIFFLLLPIYVPLALFLFNQYFLGFPWWTKLSE